MKLCDKISKLRKRKGLSQEDLANELDISRQSVFKWECGENTPDLEKIKKLAKFFNVSFDLLLDDEKDLEDEQNEAERPRSESSSLVEKLPKFRTPFDSGVKLNCSRQADYEHGYCNKRKIEGYDYSSNSIKHKQLIDKKRYSKIITIQHDILVNFFVDEQNKTFGFFFDGAPQFVCPFENLASFTISNSGLHTGFSRATGVGVGVGSITSIGVGSMPIGQTRQPSHYHLSISYFDEEGRLCDYKITFSCDRGYIIYDKTIESIETYYLWVDALSQFTNKALGELSTYLNGIKETRSILKEQSSSLPDIDTSSLSTEVKTGQDRKKSTYSCYAKKVLAHKKRVKFVWLVVCGIIAVVIVSIIIIVVCMKK